MKLTRVIRNYQQRAKALRLSVKIKNFANLHPDVSLSLEQGCSLGRTLFVSSVAEDGRQPDISIGANSYIRSGSVTWLESIGRFCSIGVNVCIGQDPNNHPAYWATTSHSVSRAHCSYPKRVKIGHDVWIGNNAFIMAGVNIGNGAIIGANALVTKDVEPYQIVGGNPAKAIKYRFNPELVKALLESQWWNKDFDELKKLDASDVDIFVAGANNITKQANYRVVEIRQGKVSLAANK